MRADDLAGLLAPGKNNPDVGFRQGVIESWDPLAGTNAVNVGGTTLTNLPTLAASTITLGPGDVVGILRYRSSWMILGAVATSPLRTRASLITATESVALDGNWHDAPTVGPVVTATIGASRQCLVSMSVGVSTVGSFTGMNVAVSGASSIAPDNANSAFAGITGSATEILSVSAASTVLLTADHGLEPGLNTFTAKYSMSTDANGSTFFNRRLAVTPF